MSETIQNKEEIRYLLKFYFKKRKNATYAVKKICDVYGPDTVSERSAREWFSRFRAGIFEVKDAPRSGRPIADKDDEIVRIIQQDRHISSYDIAKDLAFVNKLC